MAEGCTLLLLALCQNYAIHSLSGTGWPGVLPWVLSIADATQIQLSVRRVDEVGRIPAIDRACCKVHHFEPPGISTRMFTDGNMTRFKKWDQFLVLSKLILGIVQVQTNFELMSTHTGTLLHRNTCLWSMHFSECINWSLFSNPVTNMPRGGEQ